MKELVRPGNKVVSRRFPSNQQWNQELLASLSEHVAGCGGGNWEGVSAIKVDCSLDLLKRLEII